MQVHHLNEQVQNNADIQRKPDMKKVSTYQLLWEGDQVLSVNKLGSIFYHKQIMKANESNDKVNQKSEQKETNKLVIIN